MLVNRMKVLYLYLPGIFLRRNYCSAGFLIRQGKL